MIVAPYGGNRTPIEEILARPKVGSANRLARRRRIVGWSFSVLALLPVALIAMDGWGQLWAEPQKARIIGLGAATCQQFKDDVRSNPIVRRDYLAWAQGFMSGILLGRPPGVDESLDLNPATFGLISQLDFLEGHCAGNISADFADAVEALYKRLRKEGKT
jgi:hypothetical protein